MSPSSMWKVLKKFFMIGLSRNWALQNQPWFPANNCQDASIIHERRTRHNLKDSVISSFPQGAFQKLGDGNKSLVFCGHRGPPLHFNLNYSFQLVLCTQCGAGHFWRCCASVPHGPCWSLFFVAAFEPFSTTVVIRWATRSEQVIAMGSWLTSRHLSQLLVLYLFAVHM